MTRIPASYDAPTVRVRLYRDWSCVGEDRTKLVSTTTLTLGEAATLLLEVFAMQANVKVLVTDLQDHGLAVNYEYDRNLPRQIEIPDPTYAGDHYWYLYKFSGNGGNNAISLLVMMVYGLIATNPNLCTLPVYRRLQAIEAANRRVDE